MAGLEFVLQSAAVMAPGLPSLAHFRAVSRGAQPYEHAPLVVPPAAMLPAQERRRASIAVRLVLACAQEALQGCSVPASDIHTVFATDEGTGEVCQQMLEALAATRQVSPLVFSNSVVNAPSGYFSIACSNRQSSTVVSLGLESFASGLLCAVTETHARRRPVLFISYDPPMTKPMDELLCVHEAIASAWLIDGEPASQASLASFAVTLESRDAAGESQIAQWMPPQWVHCSSARGVEALRLVDAPAGSLARFGLGAQWLTLRRTGRIDS